MNDKSIEQKNISTEPGTTLVSPKNSNSLEYLQKMKFEKNIIQKGPLI